MPTLQQTWDNSQFYASSDDPRIATTIGQLKTEIAALAVDCDRYNSWIATAETIPPEEFDSLITAIRQTHDRRTAISKTLSNLSTFISSILSVNARDAQAAAQKPTIQQCFAELSQATKSLDVLLTRANDGLIDRLIQDPELNELSYSLQHQRQLQDQLLSLPEEKLITGLAVSGLQSWGNLYTELAGSLTCEVQGESMGLAKAFNLQGDADRVMREAAWKATQTAWDGQASTVASILNAINGWRWQETHQRGTKRKLHYLDKSCHQSRIDRETLNAMMDSTYDRRSIGQRALNAMGKVLQVEAMQPWDLAAPPPAVGDATKIEFDAAIDLIAKAFNQLTPEMGDFAIMMAEKGWIDAQPTPYRSTGAYCGGFAEPREPRIFMTYEGSMTNVLTLAHELGHAWHNWVMRDLPRYKTFYSMTLAETASIFAETLVRDALMAKATTTAEKLAIAWEDGAAAAVFLLNIPARFTFEQKLVEHRQTGFAVPATLKTMMRDSWQHWYETSLASYDEMFWASKLHFSIASLGFYNYPYLFGYLFSLGIYAQKERYGEAFNDLYTKLLRDTGSMSAEDLVQSHLQQDIRQPEFWQASLDIVDRGVSRFESLAGV